jgi:hypothetical protein
MYKVRTQVAQTVIARITYEAAQTKADQPTTTQIIFPSNTVALSFITATATLPIITPSASPEIPTFTPSITAKIIYPTWTSTFYPDSASLSWQTPADGTYYHLGEDFDLVYQIMNSGGRNWNQHYYLKFVNGIPGKTQDGQAVTLVYFSRNVTPGETISLVIDMVAPQEPGTYSSNWALVNDNGIAFFWPNLVFIVAE